ncbi:MAG TPA: hypothetical protein VHG70_16975 [Nocardioidaceae bacterium]|nr:hypothetical protein [Nocardioidaceae bacterium]
MKFRRIIAAAVSTVALLAVNVGMADSAAAGSSWGIAPRDGQVQTTEGSSWGTAPKGGQTRTLYGPSWG